jgi:hypothetical protein
MITLATLDKATAQEVLDQAVTHLLTQNAKSVVGGHCAYRGDNRLKCAAGCFIADDEYEPEMERKSWYGMVTSGYVPTAAHKTLMQDLQCAHDNNPLKIGETPLKNLQKTTV